MNWIKTYGEPGGFWMGLTLNVEAGVYEVYNEDGDLLFEDLWETEAVVFCERQERGRI